MKKSNAGAIVAFIVVLLLIIGGIGSCISDDDKSDIAYDEDGFLGYSDEFWEWYQDNN